MRLYFHKIVINNIITLASYQVLFKVLFINLFILFILFLAVSGLRCCTQAFL